MAKLLASGRISQKDFGTSYNAWKNHISHGNCYKLSKAMDEIIQRKLTDENKN